MATNRGDFNGAVVERLSGGRVGRRITVRANYFPLLVRGQKLAVHQYHVEILHGVSRKLEREENRRIFWEAVKNNPRVFKDKYGNAYDGQHLLYTTYEIPIERNRLIEFPVELQLERDLRKHEMRVAIQHANDIVLDLTEKPVTFDERCTSPINVLDIILRQAVTCPFVEVSKKFFAWNSSCYRIPRPNSPALALDGGKEMWTGFFCSAHYAQNYMPVLNVDVAHTVFYKQNMPVIEFLCELLNERYNLRAERGNGGGRSGSNGSNHSPRRNQGNSRTQPEPFTVETISRQQQLSAHETRLFNDSVRGLRIRITHRGDQKRVYKVNGVHKTPATLFFNETDTNGKERVTTVAEYFKERYGQLRWEELPCLHVGPQSRNIYMPLEVCEIVGPQKYDRKLTDRQTSSIIRAAAVDADQRQLRIQDLLKQAGFDKDPFLKAFNVSVKPEMLEAEARVLPAPAIEFGPRANGDGANIVHPKDGAWSMENQRLFEPAPCRGYALLAFCGQREQDHLEHFAKAMFETATHMGMKFPRWPEAVRYISSPNSLRGAVESALDEFIQLKLQVDLLLVVMLNKNAEVYATVKEISDMHVGINSQCILMRNVQRPSPATCANLVLKINAKLGGVNSRVIYDRLTESLRDVPTLVLGVDVTHPTQAEERQGMPSIAAVVGNVDQPPERFYASVKVQRKSRESVVYMFDGLRERFEHFVETTGRRPERIIVYRDGVSDGQFREILIEEMGSMREACRGLDPSYKPPITYIVVQKRHHTRLFCKNPSDTVGKAKNIPPGTAVDTGITSPEGFDFYLCSHFGIQGTSRPTRYSVLYDENKFTSDQLQAITFYMCHNYVRCARSVSIPSPVYYADLVATRSRAHIRRIVGCGQGSLYDEVMSRSGGSRGSSGSRSSPLGSEADVDDMLQKYINVKDSVKNTMYFV